MRKIFFFLFCIIFTVSLVGCGKASETPQEGESSTEKTTIEYVDPNISNIEMPEDTSTEEPVEIEGLINSPETPCGKEDPDYEEVSYVPDIEPYFNGDSFRLEEYLEDCGADSVEITSDGCVSVFYDWTIDLRSRNCSEIPQFYITNELNGKTYCFDPSGDPNIGNFYIVDNNNTLICEASIRKLPDLLNALYDNGFAYEPPVVYGLITNY